MGQSISTKNRTLEIELRTKGLFPHTSAPWQQRVLKEFLSQVTVGPDFTCLECACGIGNNLPTLLNYFRHITAFDQSEKALQFAKGRCVKEYNNCRVNFLKSDLTAIALPDESFDCVVCTEALEHTEDYRQAIKELYRVTKSGGYVIVSFQNHFNFSAIIKFIYETLHGRNWDVWGTHNHDTGYENYVTCFQIMKVVRELGFDLINANGADYINAWLSWLPIFYRNYEILDKYPFLSLGKIPLLKYLGMDCFMLLKKTATS